ncbi:DUF397 domain-containing protein [Streptomyces sp. CNQ085]|uniref:DUF397 domain-containing protein n=1 Tax=Streptomyces sp. CNQ085 TaxID=2886944 RepID=UPI001F506E3E|nr:DUF397 domain-containing protein [Streptomyces sp. CNQ085]MCI0386541.1 DUF397 domain-containing protein [Streptomyces sp. CNQ085]
MSELVWTKSSFSEAGGNNCVEVAADDGDGIAVRESTDPGRVLTTDRAAFRALVRGAKAGAFDRLVR